MSGVFGGSKSSASAPAKTQTMASAMQAVAAAPASTAERASAEEKAATRRAARRGGMRGLLSQARLGGEQSTLGSVVQ